MHSRRRGLFTVFLALAVCPLLAAANITYTFTGTLGPVLSGSDPLSANGQTGTVTAVASTSLVPTSHTSTSATYKLPSGSVIVIIGGTSYPTTGPSTVVYKFPASGPDAMVITSTVNVNGINGTATMNAVLAHGSITSKVLSHPTRFTPSPQNLKPATTAGGPGSQVKYTIPLLGTTVLGLTGTASN